MRRTPADSLAMRARGWADRHAATALFVGVVLLGLLWRADAALRISFPTVDGVHYMHTARDLVRDGRLSFSTFPPGWPLLIAGVVAVHGQRSPADMLLTAQGLNVVLGTAAAVLVFVLVRRHANSWWALLAASSFVLLPENVTASANDLSEMSYVFFALAAWLVAERRFGWIAGVFFGVAYLVRPEALLVFAALLVAHVVRERRVPVGAALTAGGIVLVYVVFMRAATGAWMLSSKNAFLEDAVAERGSWDLITQWAQNAVVLVRPLPELIGMAAVVLAMLGLAVARGRWWLALLPVLVVPLFTFRMEVRYWIPYVPFLLLYAVLGARWIIARWPRARAATTSVIVVSIVVGAVSTARPDWRYVGANFEYYPGMRDAGLWLSTRLQPGDVVADYKPYVAFWADAPFRKFPRGRDAAGIVDWARENGLDYLVVNAHLVSSLTPELAPLLHELPPQLARKITLVHVASVEGDPRQTTLLYRVEPVGGRGGTRSDKDAPRTPPGL